MPAPLAIGGILLTVLIGAVIRILLALGIGFISFTVALPSFYSYLTDFFSTLPPDVFAMAGILRVDQAITLILSALAARLAYKISATSLINLT
jgi:hypothetical protein